MLVVRLAAIFLALLLTWPCSGRAQALAPHAKPMRPLVFIPGIAGSELWINGRRAWGSVAAMIHLEDLRIPQGPTRIAAAPTCDPANTDPKYRDTCGPINEFVLLGPMKYDQYEPLFQYLETLGYVRTGPGKNLYVFAYDWRRSNFDTAEQLDAFIRSTPGLNGKQVDILAHSMGGLIALIHAHRHDAPRGGNGNCDFPRSCRVQTIVTMGTPYFGSVKALSTPVLGWGWLSRKLAGGQDAIARTVLSWPSLYELLPTYDGCCAAEKDGASRPLDLLNPPDFAALPLDLAKAGVAPDKLAEALKNAAEIKKLVGLGFPRHVRSASACSGIPAEGFFAIAGDRNGTQQSVTATGGKMNFLERRGDGTVLLRSASIGNPAGAFLSFVPHMSIFADEHVKAKLESILFRCEMGFKDFKAVVPTITLARSLATPDVLPVEFVSAELVDVTGVGPDTYAVRGVMALSAPDDALAPKVLVRARLNGLEFYRGEASLKQRRLDGSLTRWEYEHGPLVVPGRGRVELSLTFGDQGPTAVDETLSLGP